MHDRENEPMVNGSVSQLAEVVTEMGGVAPSVRRFDGIICFGGEDWWYHNRGHFDMQLMRRLRTTVPVLYVNSIGMRTPGPAEGRMFARRIGRKLRSLRRGTVDIEPGFAVMSPPVLPGPMGMRTTRRVATQLIARAARRRRIKRPLVWVACPTAVELLESLPSAGVVYQRTDRYETFTGVNEGRIADCDRRLKRRADLTVFCSRALFDEERSACCRATLIDHGVDYDHFAAAGDANSNEPAELIDLPKPRVGFVGSIDAHTFDPELILEVAHRLPDVQFVLVGGCTLPNGWCDAPNVALIGQQPYERVASFMAAFDVLIMPWNRSRWIEACNPVKLKEYLSIGRPIVSTPFRELETYGDLVRRASTPTSFATEIRAALHEPFDKEAGRARVRDASWTARANEVVERLAAVRLSPIPWRVDASRATNEVRPGAPSLTNQGSAKTRALPVELELFVILAGGLRPSPLMEATDCSVLDLWLSAERRVIDAWMAQFEACASLVSTRPAVRVLTSAHVPSPWPEARGGLPVTFELDPQAYRGPAGSLRDLCRDLPDNAHVVVVEGGRWLSGSLTSMLERHVQSGADVTMGVNPDDTPGGIYLVRCGALKPIPPVGFTDLKEQWLPRAIEAGLEVRVEPLVGAGTLPLHTREQFLAACWAAAESGSSPMPTDRRRGAAPRRVICSGALVGPGAEVVDSVLMPGSVVEPGAVVQRSLLVPGARVQAETGIADAIVTAHRALSDESVAGRNSRRKGLL
jgi:glycosyltransferase involved in cell wall biosynthesis